MYVQIVYANAVMHETSTRNRKARLFVFGVELSRDMSRVVKSKKDVRTITFPSTVREVSDGAFSGTSVRSAVLNEGLEELGEHYGHNSVGAFGRTPLSRVVLPSTLRTTGDCTFYMCEQLKRVIFANGSRLEWIGKYCFFESGLEETMILSIQKMFRRASPKAAIVSERSGQRPDVRKLVGNDAEVRRE